MNSNLCKAKEILLGGGYTLVLYDGNDVVVSNERGVKPLLSLLENGKCYSGYSACDKVVGSAAAYLYVILSVKEVYALTLSENARAVFEKYGVTYFCDNIVPNIINRKGDGLCPMEQSTLNAQSPEDALRRIKEKIKELQSK